MKTRSKLLPGQKGTKSLQKQYGDALVCVRYRYDETNGKQLKTVEIIDKIYTAASALKA